MASADLLEESAILVDSYGTSSPLVRLAQLASPACRIEPQLLRHLRLACVPEADVSIEQELWHSELVNSRGKFITFREGVVRVLRTQLRALRAQQPDLVGRARAVMADVHAELPRLLALEDRLAWAEAFDEGASIASDAQTLLTSLRARRDGLDHWLGRAWNALPADLKRSPEGRALGQVAAAKGARVESEASATSAEAVAHLLPLAPLPLKLEGLALHINVRPSDATHAIDVPQTQPRAISVTSSGRREEVVFALSETKRIHVGPGIVVLRTLSGAEYELEASRDAVTATLEVELLPARGSTSLIIRFGIGSDRRRILVDCGDRRLGQVLVERFKQPNALDEPIDLLVLTHIDADRIGGAIPLLESEVLTGHLPDVWFNDPDQLRPSQRSAS